MAANNLSNADLEDPKFSSGVCGHTKMVHTHMWAKHKNTTLSESESFYYKARCIVQLSQELMA